MSLADGSRLLPFLSPPNKPHSSPSPPFDEALIARLNSLLPLGGSEPSVPLAWLARAADVLTATLADAADLVSDPALSGSEKDALATHLDASASLLDAANAASADLDRMARRSLLLRLALRFLASGSTRKARGYIAEWEAATHSTAANLITGLRPLYPPRGRISAVGRAVYAVEAVCCLTAGTIAAALKGETVDLSELRASGEFPWAEAYGKVVSAVSGQIGVGSHVSEVGAVESHVRRLASAIDDVAEEEEEVRNERIRSAAEAAAGAVEVLTEAAERLARAVNGMFRAAMTERNAALLCFRIPPQKCR